MISEIRNVVSNKVIDNIKDELGRNVYEAWKNLPISGMPPLILTKCKGENLIGYKIDGNSVQDGTPTPDTPIEVESVGDKTKNLFKTPLNNSTENATITCNNGIYKITSGNQYDTFDLNGAIRTGQWLPTYENANDYNLTEKGGVYTLSFNFNSKSEAIEGHYFVIYTNYQQLFIVHFKNMSFQYSTKITLKDDEYIKSLYLWTTNTESIDAEFTIQLEKGTVATEYEPYGCKIPVKVSGKNLLPFKDGINFDLRGINYSTKDGSLYLNGSSVGEAYSNDSMFINNFLFELKAGTYTMSQPKGYGATTYLDDENNKHIVTLNGNTLLSTTFTLETDTIVHLGFYMYQRTYDNFKLPLMLERGENITDYEPYAERTTTNIYLNAPLRKIRDYADYIDFENGKVVRNINETKLTDTDNWSLQNSRFTMWDIADIITDNEYMENINVLSDYYEGISTRNRDEMTDMTIMKTKGEHTQIAVSDSRYTTVEEFKTFLSSNPITIQYVLETPIEEPIELPNIPTIKGTTILSVDTNIQPSNVKVIYKGKE